MRVDLHTHSNKSDGSLTPAELLEHARGAGLDVLAITDHDTTAAYAALTPQLSHGLTLIRGVEFSSWWHNLGIHIVGLNIDTEDPALISACTRQAQARTDRAHTIAAHLAAKGIENAYAGAAAYAAGAAIGRPHFATFLVSIGAAASPAQAFRKYLGGRHAPRAADFWASMDTVIGWITAAGGIAVLAHPARYKLSRSRLHDLVSAFCAAGGGALEVISGQQQPATTRQLGELAQRFDLSASVGSDFHQPDRPWAALGSSPPLAAGLRPVWAAW